MFSPSCLSFFLPCSESLPKGVNPTMGTFSFISHSHHSLAVFFSCFHGANSVPSIGEVAPSESSPRFPGTSLSFLLPPPISSYISFSRLDLILVILLDAFVIRRGLPLSLDRGGRVGTISSHVHGTYSPALAKSSCLTVTRLINNSLKTWHLDVIITIILMTPTIY